MTDNWAYRNYLRWKKDYPQCAGDKQSPINIDTSNVADCNELCRLSVRYQPSKCYITNKNRTPIIRFDPGSFIKFKGALYELKEMKMHTPSMHTVNGEHYDMEINLYHYLNSSDITAGGVIVSILLQRGSGDSDANHFLSQFANQIPADEIEGERDIKVSKKWSAEQLFPNIKSFFYYNGSMPMPPCYQNWTWIVFEETSILEETLYKSIELTFKNNRRPIRGLKDRTVYYNNNIKFDGEDEYQRTKLDKEIKKLSDKRDSIGVTKPRISEKDRNRMYEEESLQLEKLQAAKTNNWFVNNKQTIKNILITIILLLIVFSSIKITKYLVRSGFITDFSNKQIENLKIKQIADSKLEGKRQNFNATTKNLATGERGMANMEMGGPTNVGESNNNVSSSMIRASR